MTVVALIKQREPTVQYKKELAPIVWGVRYILDITLMVEDSKL
jgi:hypothetical protein